MLRFLSLICMFGVSIQHIHVYKYTNQQKHVYLDHNEHVPWTDSKGYVQGENI